MKISNNIIALILCLACLGSISAEEIVGSSIRIKLPEKLTSVKELFDLENDLRDRFSCGSVTGFPDPGKDSPKQLYLSRIGLDRNGLDYIYVYRNVGNVYINVDSFVAKDSGIFQAEFDEESGEVVYYGGYMKEFRIKRKAKIFPKDPLKF